MNGGLPDMNDLKEQILPYRDTKPIGAADFYFAINATFRFVHRRFGLDELRRYWTDLGTCYFAPVSAAWKKRGLPGVAAHWEAFFHAEPGAQVDVRLSGDRVILDVRVCPAISYLREHRREIVPRFCEHCYFIGEAMAATAGLTLRVEGGNGSCRQTFCRRDSDLPNQDLAKIKEASC